MSNIDFSKYFPGETASQILMENKHHDCTEGNIVVADIIFENINYDGKDDNVGGCAIRCHNVDSLFMLVTTCTFSRVTSPYNGGAIYGGRQSQNSKFGVYIEKTIGTLCYTTEHLNNNDVSSQGQFISTHVGDNQRNVVTLCSASFCPDYIRKMNQRPFYLEYGKLEYSTINSTNNRGSSCAGMMVNHGFEKFIYCDMVNCTNQYDVALEFWDSVGEGKYVNIIDCGQEATNLGLMNFKNNCDIKLISCNVVNPKMPTNGKPVSTTNSVVVFIDSYIDKNIDVGSATIESPRDSISYYPVTYYDEGYVDPTSVVEVSSQDEEVTSEEKESSSSEEKESSSEEEKESSSEEKESSSEEERESNQNNNQNDGGKVNSNMEAIIGGSVAGGILLIVIIAVTLFIVLRWKKSKKS